MNYTHKLVGIAIAGLLAFQGQSVWGQEVVQESASEKPQQSFGVIQMKTSDSETGDVQVFTTMNGWSGDNITLASPMMMGDEFGMIGNPMFQDELNLVAEQKDEISKLNQEFSRKMSEFFKSEGGRMNLENPGAIKDFMAEIQQAKAAKVKEILLPHQIDRLKQISLQSEMKMRGDSESLTGDKLAEALGIDDDQKQRIKDKAKELKEQLEKEIEELKEKARNELLRELTREQRDELQSMLGDKFDYRGPNISDRIQNLRSKRRQKSDK